MDNKTKKIMKNIAKRIKLSRKFKVFDKITHIYYFNYYEYITTDYYFFFNKIIFKKHKKGIDKGLLDLSFEVIGRDENGKLVKIV